MDQRRLCDSPHEVHVNQEGLRETTGKKDGVEGLFIYMERLSVQYPQTCLVLVRSHRFASTATEVSGSCPLLLSFLGVGGSGCIGYREALIVLHMCDKWVQFQSVRIERGTYRDASIEILTASRDTPEPETGCPRYPWARAALAGVLGSNPTNPVSEHPMNPAGAIGYPLPEFIS